jgi:hypothetical protein
MMSSSSFTTCPSWDSGCTTSPLSNLNALASPPGAPRNRAAPADNVWSDNVYSGPWGWYAYLFGACAPLPADAATGKSMPSGACGILDLSTWNADWQQDRSSG